MTASNRIAAAFTAIRDHQEQLDETGVVVAVSREALNYILSDYLAAWRELHCCDDVPLDRELADGIAAMQRDRETSAGKLRYLANCLRERDHGNWVIALDAAEAADLSSWADCP